MKLKLCAVKAIEQHSIEQSTTTFIFISKVRNLIVVCTTVLLVTEKLNCA
jgi:hypothetical protein